MNIEEQWEKEFEERFRRWILNDGEENYGLYRDDWIPVKLFIQSLLDQQRQEIIKELKKMDEMSHVASCGCIDKDQAISKIKEME